MYFLYRILAAYAALLRKITDHYEINTSLQLFSVVWSSWSFPPKKQPNSNLPLESNLCPGHLGEAMLKFLLSPSMASLSTCHISPRGQLNTCSCPAVSVTIDNQDRLKLCTSQSQHFKSDHPKQTCPIK